MRPLQRIRLIREYIRAAKEEHPDATPDEIKEIVSAELKDEFGDDPSNLNLLLQLLLKLLTIFV